MPASTLMYLAFPALDAYPFHLDLSSLLKIRTVISKGNSPANKKTLRVYTIEKQVKFIALLAQAKHDSISNAIWQRVQDGNISSAEFHNIQQDMEKYCKLKEAIRRQSEAKVRQIPKKSEKNRLKKEKRKARKIVSKNFKYFRYPRCQWNWKHAAPQP